MNNKLYTAVGKLKMKDQNDVRILCVSIGQKEYILNEQEMVLWMELNYKVLNADEVHKLCGNKTWETGSNAEECIRRLVQRGLIAEGSGDTKEDIVLLLLKSYLILPVSSLRRSKHIQIISVNRSKKCLNNVVSAVL